MGPSQFPSSLALCLFLSLLLPPPLSSLSSREAPPGLPSLGSFSNQIQKYAGEPCAHPSHGQCMGQLALHRKGWRPQQLGLCGGLVQELSEVAVLPEVAVLVVVW